MHHHHHHSSHHRHHAGNTEADVEADPMPDTTQEKWERKDQVGSREPKPAMRKEPKTQPEPEVRQLYETTESSGEEHEESLVDRSVIRRMDESLVHYLKNSIVKDADGKPVLAPMLNVTQDPHDPDLEDGDIEYRACDAMPIDNLCPKNECKDDDECSHIHIKGKRNFGCRCSMGVPHELFAVDKNAAGCWTCQCSHAKLGCHPHGDAQACVR